MDKIWHLSCSYLLSNHGYDAEIRYDKYGGQNLTLMRIMTRAQVTKSFNKKFTTLRVHPGVSATSSLYHIQPLSHQTFSKASFVLKASLVWSHTLPLRDHCLLEVFPIPEVPNPKSEAQNISPPRSSPTLMQLHPPHVHMWHLLSAWTIIESDRFFSL